MAISSFAARPSLSEAIPGDRRRRGRVYQRGGFGLAGTETKLGILPLGTLNHFARDLGIPTDLDEAARLIASGAERRVDIGEMNERVFINNSAIGLYPLMVIDRDLQRKRLGRSKRLAMIVASLRTLARFNHHRLTLTVNEERTGRVDTPLLFVGNNDYRIDIGAPGRRERMDGGELCVLVMRKKTRRGLLAAELFAHCSAEAEAMTWCAWTASNAFEFRPRTGTSPCPSTARWFAPGRRFSITNPEARAAGHSAIAKRMILATHAEPA